MSGAEISLVGLVSNLDRAEYRPVVVCPHRGELPRELQRLGIQIEPLDFMRIRRGAGTFKLSGHLLRIAKAAPKLKALAAKHDIHLIHSNNTTAQMFGAAAAGLSRIPSIWTVRDLVPLGGLGRILYKLSSCVLVPSEAVELEVRRYGSGKVKKISNGIDLEKWNGLMAENGTAGSASAEGIRSEFGIAPSDVVIAMVGQLVPWKGHRYLLEAAGIFSKRAANAKVLIVGGDLFAEHRAYVEELKNMSAKLGIRERVVFTGHRNDVHRLLSAVDILVLPSLNEPFGRILLEAMACEKPVVASNSGGPREIIRDGTEGILVAEKDSEQIAGAVTRLIEDEKLRRDMGRAGRRRVEEFFDIRSKVKEIEELYRELVA